MAAPCERVACMCERKNWRCFASLPACIVLRWWPGLAGLCSESLSQWCSSQSEGTREVKALAQCSPARVLAMAESGLDWQSKANNTHKTKDPFVGI
jgi:hypothetical protein